MIRIPGMLVLVSLHQFTYDGESGSGKIGVQGPFEPTLTLAWAMATATKLGNLKEQNLRRQSGSH